MEIKLVDGLFDGETRKIDTGYIPYAIILTILNTENNRSIRILYKHTKDNEYKYVPTDNDHIIKFIQEYIEDKNKTTKI